MNLISLSSKTWTAESSSLLKPALSNASTAATCIDHYYRNHTLGSKEKTSVIGKTVVLAETDKVNSDPFFAYPGNTLLAYVSKYQHENNSEAETVAAFT